MPSIQAQLNYAQENPLSALKDLARADAEESLRDFIPIVWPVLEPATEFVPGWSIDAVCEHLEAISRGEIRKLLINVPPGFMKSLLTGVLWPVWEWGPQARPELRYISASYSRDLAIRDSRKARLVIESEEYRELWGDRFELVSDQNSKIKYENDHRGFRFATSVGGQVTGERGDRILVDDPHNVKDAESEAIREEALKWFAEVLPTRVTNPLTSSFLVIMQRVHERDTSGLILAEELGYEHLMLPMEFEPDRKCYSRLKPTYIDSPEMVEVYFNDIEKAWHPVEAWEPKNDDDVKPKTEFRWPADLREVEGELLWPARFPKDYIDNDLKPSLRSWGGSYAEAGQLQQRPSPRGGGMFKKEDWQFIEPNEAKDITTRTVRGYDLAATKKTRAAYTAGVKMTIDQHRRVIIFDVERYQETSSTVEKNMLRTATLDGRRVVVDIPQDPGAGGKAWYNALVKNLHGFIVEGGPESGDKEIRALPLSAQVEAQNVYLVRGSWNEAFINEAALFPAGTFKDQIDAGSRAYANLNSKKTTTTGIGATVSIGIEL